jgi:hypothetical protein
MYIYISSGLMLVNFCFLELAVSNPAIGETQPGRQGRSSAGQESEPTLDLVEPEGVDWRMTEMGRWLRRQPVLAFRMSVGSAVVERQADADVGVVGEDLGSAMSTAANNIVVSCGR